MAVTLDQASISIRIVSKTATADSNAVRINAATSPALVDPRIGDWELTMSVREIAETANVNSETVRKWLRDGKLRGARHEGRQWVIPRSALNDIVPS